MRLDGHGCAAAVAAADCSVDDCEDAFLLVDANEDRKDGFYVGAAPSEDIWRKFELETPPRSPVHVLLCDEYGDMWAAASPPRQGFEQYSLRSKLIQDCMWSGQTAAAAVAAASDRSSPQGAAAAASWVTGDRLFRKIESFDVPSTSSSVVAAVTGPSAAASTAAAAECVGDSAAVFPYPLNREHSYSMMTPAPSDSEDEIDVVGMENTRIKVTTVRRTQQLSAVSCYQQQQLPQQAPKVTAAVAAAADRGTIIVDVNHNRLSAAVAERLLSAQKRPLRGAGAATAAVAAPAAGSHHYHHGCKRARRQQQQHSPPPSSGHASSEDSEDFDGKRSMHNVLERKRRNDLKSSFFQLRDQVPELRHQERAAKVVILAKATEYTRRLRQEELGLLAEISAERQKQARILEQLERLRTSCHRY